MHRTTINPWPTPAQKLDQLHSAVKTPVSGDLFWQTLTEEEQSRLGGDFGAAFEKYRGTVGICCKLRGFSPRRSVLAVARRIDLLSEYDYTKLVARLGESANEFEARIQYAVEGHRLVLVKSRRQLYFCGQVIDFSRHQSEWTLMQLLVARAPTNRLVSPDEVNAETVEPWNYISKVISRMSIRSGVPPEFGDLLESPNKDGACRLKLEASEICVIE